MYAAVLDACILVPYPLCDILLRAAERNLYRPLWSDSILDETERTLVNKINVAQDAAAYRVRRMRDAFPDAAVTGYEELIGVMTNHPKDRHVLAAAVRANAGALVTANLKDFPENAVAPFGIAVKHPDEFLLDLLDLSEVAMVGALVDMSRARANPPSTPNELVEQLRNTVPKFASDLGALV